MATTNNNVGLSTNTEVVEKKVDVEQALSRVRRPLDATSLNLEVYGVYSLPDAWKAKVVSFNIQMLTFINRTTPLSNCTVMNWSYAVLPSRTLR